MDKEGGVVTLRERFKQRRRGGGHPALPWSDPGGGGHPSPP